MRSDISHSLFFQTIRLILTPMSGLLSIVSGLLIFVSGLLSIVNSLLIQVNVGVAYIYCNMHFLPDPSAPSAKETPTPENQTPTLKHPPPTPPEREGELNNSVAILPLLLIKLPSRSGGVGGGCLFFWCGYLLAEGAEGSLLFPISPYYIRAHAIYCHKNYLTHTSHTSHTQVTLNSK